MSTLLFQDFLTYAKTRIEDKTQLKKAISIALGIAISRHIDLPSSRVDSAQLYYMNTPASIADQLIGAFNEGLIINFELASATARAFWLVRYANAHPAEFLTIPNADEKAVLPALIGIGHVIPPDTHDFCKDNLQAMVSLINRCAEVIKTLQQAAV